MTVGDVAFRLLALAGSDARRAFLLTDSLVAQLVLGRWLHGLAIPGVAAPGPGLALGCGAWPWGRMGGWFRAGGELS